jgi:Ca-activated chloride channel family protein
MSWQHPLILVAIPLALAGAWWLFRGRAAADDDRRLPNVARRWADRLGLHSAAPVMSRRARGLALALAAALALVALARPQWGEVPEQSVSRSREVMIALDLSQSMMADDVSPTRLARAKLLVDALLDALHGERVGLTVFAGTAFVQSPLSADYEVLREFLGALDTSYLPQGGTDYASMLNAAANAFGEQGDGARYLVVLSDGEATDDEWQKAMPALKARGIRVIGLGVGTPQGALVPDPAGGVLKDESGNAVLSKLEPATLQQLAEQTGGTYRDAATWVDIADLVGTTVAKGHAGDYVEERRVRLEDRFQWFLAPALLLFLFSYWLELPLSPLARAFSTRGSRPRRATAPVIAAALVGLAAWQPPRQALAVAADTSPSQSVATVSRPSDLSATVAELSAKPSLDVPDFERLANDTIGFASQPSAPRDGTRDGIIDDALAAVDRGEQRDAQAADWPTLRQKLEALRKPPEQPKQDPQDQSQKQDQQKQNQQNQQGQNQDQKDQQQNAGGEQNQEDEQQQNAGGGSPQDQKNGQDQKDQQQNGGGEQAKNDEQKQDGQSSPRNAEARQDQKQDGEGAAPQQQAEQKDDQQKSGAEQQADARQPDGEVKPQADAKPLDSAGLGDEQQPQEAKQEPKSEPQAKPAQPQGTRMVGGGQVLASAEQSSDPATADALARMAHVKDGDSPAVLFDRMNRADGQPQPKHNGKNW